MLLTDSSHSNYRPSTLPPKQHGIQTQGILYNYNTIEEFKKADKTALLSSVADSVSLSFILQRNSIANVSPLIDLERFSIRYC